MPHAVTDRNEGSNGNRGPLNEEHHNDEGMRIDSIVQKAGLDDGQCSLQKRLANFNELLSCE